MLDNQQSMFDIMYPKYKITKPIRLIEMFGGYGSQHFALKYLGANVEHWKLVEWAVKSIQAYKDAHYTNIKYDFDNTITKEVLVDYLFKMGISFDYNKPATLQEIQRRKFEELKTIALNIKTTNNLVNICNVKGKDLEIIDQDKYDYIITYSFPCQDLSLAGLRKGMNDTSTRSGMLWEVERILKELNELGTLPQILLMENVPQVIGTENVNDFNKWQTTLESLGYKNYHQNLIATDYGIPQTRNRTFMISILGDYSYSFPNAIPLKLKLKDMLEDNVDEKYYLSEDLIKHIQKTKQETKEFTQYERYNGELEMWCRIWKNKAPTMNTKCNETKVYVKEATKKGYAIATEGDSINLEQPNSTTRRGRVGKGVAQTLMTNPQQVVAIGNYSPSNHNASRIVDSEFSAPTVMENHGTITAIVEKNLKSKLCNDLIINGIAKENDVIKHSYTGQIMDGNKKCIEMNNLMPTMTTRPDCLGVTVKEKNNLKIRKLTPKECFRLMGVKDEDYENIAKNQSDASLYHLAGDSIVVNVLMAIFKELL